MATSYEDIYNRAVFRFKDYDFLTLDESQVSEVLHSYLNSAISDFEPVCDTDLSARDESGMTFIKDLDNETQEILALGIEYYWLSARLVNSELLKNSLSTKDYQYFSPANLLRESQTLRDEVRKEYRDRIVQYTYHHGDIASMSAN